MIVYNSGKQATGRCKQVILMTWQSSGWHLMFTKAHMIRPLKWGYVHKSTHKASKWGSWWSPNQVNQYKVLIRSLSSELQPVNQTGGPAPKQNVNNVCLQSNRKITFLEEIICYNTNLNDLMC